MQEVDYPLLTEMDEFYVGVRPGKDGRPDHMFGYFKHVMSIWVNQKTTPIQRVRLVPVSTVEEADAFSWETKNSDGVVRWGMTHNSLQLFDMCFPYGYKASEENNRGKMIPMRVEVLEEYPFE